MCEMLPPLLSSDLQSCIEKSVSNEKFENTCDHMIEGGVITWVRPKLLQQSPSAFEGNAEAWPGWPDGENLCHATNVSQTCESGGNKKVEPRLPLPVNHYQ